MRVKTEERRQAIIDVAAKVFREEGFDRASMSEIAKRLGGSKATLYSYFTSKEELFTAVMRQSPEVGDVFSRFTDPNAEIGSIAKLRENLEHFALGFLRLHLKPDVLAMRRNMIAEGDRSDVSRLAFEAGPRHNLTSLAAHLERAMQEGLIRKEVPWTAMSHLLGLVESEIVLPRLLGLIKEFPQEFIRAAALRAVDAYLRAYALDEVKAPRKKEHAHS